MDLVLISKHAIEFRTNLQVFCLEILSLTKTLIYWNDLGLKQNYYSETSYFYHLMVLYAA